VVEVGAMIKANSGCALKGVAAQIMNPELGSGSGGAKPAVQPILTLEDLNVNDLNKDNSITIGTGNSFGVKCRVELRAVRGENKLKESVDEENEETDDDGKNNDDAENNKDKNSKTNNSLPPLTKLGPHIGDSVSINPLSQILLQTQSMLIANSKSRYLNNIGITGSMVSKILDPEYHLEVKSKTAIKHCELLKGVLPKANHMRLAE
jgi:hypothetical protein